MPQAVAFWISIAVLLAAGAATFASVRVLSDTGRWVAHSHEVLDQIDVALSTVKDAETAQRGFLLAGKPEYLAPYRQAIEALPAQLTRLRQLTAGNPSQQKRIVEFEAVTRERLALISHNLALYDQGRFTAETAVPFLDRGKQAMDRVRQMSAAMRIEEQRLLKRRLEEFDAAKAWSAVATVATIALSIVLLVAIRHTAARDAAIIERSRELLQRSQADLSRQLALLETIYANVPVGLSFLDRELRFVSVNETLAQINGLGARDHVGKAASQILPADVARLLEERSAQVLGSGRPVTLEFETSTRIGEPLALQRSWYPVRQDGQIIGIGEVVQDITEARQAAHRVHQLNAELEERVEQRTRQLSDANAELEAFSYTIAHDLRAPLRHMHSLSDALMDDYAGGLDATGQDYLRRIANAAMRMDALIQDLLAYARLGKDQLHLHTVDLERSVSDVLQELAPVLEDAQAVVDVQRPLGAVLAHRGTLEQVLANLVSNAVKFVAPGVRPHVSVRSESRGARLRLRLWVEDNGIGIEPRHAQRIFRVFERLHTHEAYPGTGIGLAIVKKSIEWMGGAAGVESEPGRGSRFWIELAQENRPHE